jgi:hypothetical protein
MYTMPGERFYKYDDEWPASGKDWEFAKMWMGLTEKVGLGGEDQAHPRRIEVGGLEGILKGTEELKTEKVRGEKLVYRISDKLQMGEGRHSLSVEIGGGVGAGLPFEM